MGLGSTAKKLQNLVDVAEDLYQRVNDLRDRMIRMEQTINETSDSVENLESELTELQAVLDVIAEEEGIDVEAVKADLETAGAATEGDSGSSDENA